MSQSSRLSFKSLSSSLRIVKSPSSSSVAKTRTESGWIATVDQECRPRTIAGCPDLEPKARREALYDLDDVLFDSVVLD